jgi:hypothetical protein
MRDITMIKVLLALLVFIFSVFAFDVAYKHLKKDELKPYKDLFEDAPR